MTWMWNQLVKNKHFLFIHRYVVRYEDAAADRLFCGYLYYGVVQQLREGGEGGGVTRCVTKRYEGGAGLVGG